MKTKVTKKSIKNSYRKIIHVGAGDIQNLLMYKRPFAYSSGVFGWDCDYYDIDGVCICEEYRTFGQDVNYWLLKKYDDKASVLHEKYWNKQIISREECEKKIDKLIISFLDEV